MLDTLNKNNIIISIEPMSLIVLKPEKQPDNQQKRY